MKSRKSGKELRKEYQGLLDKTSALETRIRNRTKTLLKQYPNVLVGEIVTAKDILDGWDIDTMHPDYCFTFIEKIEQHIADQHPHKQTEMFKNSVTKSED